MFLEVVVPDDFLQKYIWNNNNYAKTEVWEPALLLQANSFIKNFTSILIRLSLIMISQSQPEIFQGSGGILE